MENENNVPTTTEEVKVTKPRVKNGMMFKKDDQIGELVKNGITKTLKLANGEEIILSPAEFKEWELVEFTVVEDIPPVEEPKEEPVEKAEKPKKSTKVKETPKPEPMPKPEGHISFKEFMAYMTEHYGEEDVTGVVVYSQRSFLEEYSLESRSYRTNAMQSAFKKSIKKKSDKVLEASSIAGDDPDINLLEYPWEVEYCYID